MKKAAISSLAVLTVLTVVTMLSLPACDKQDARGALTAQDKALNIAPLPAYSGAQIPASSFDAELAGKTHEDMTSFVYQRLPFLKPGLRFFNAYVILPSVNVMPAPSSRGESAMYAVRSDNKVIKLEGPDNFVVLGMKLRSQDDALILVRFYSDLGFVPAPRSRNNAQRTGYWELKEYDSCIKVAGWKPPSDVSTRSEASPGGTNYVVSRNLIANAPDTLAQGGSMTVSEIVRATETVRSDGAYAITTELLPSPGLQVRGICVPE